MELNPIVDLDKKWDEALENGRPECLLELVTDDYERDAAVQGKTVGKEAFFEAVKPYFDNFRFENSRRQVEEQKVAGDWVFVSGTWTGRVVPKNGDAPYEASATWMDIREKQADGSYKISRAFSQL